MPTAPSGSACSYRPRRRATSWSGFMPRARMCQYSAVEGSATDWHFTHINSLALSGAAMFCIEATGVEAIGRITPGCLGLYNDANEAALKPIVASVRRHSKAAIAMQLAHA